MRSTSSVKWNGLARFWPATDEPALGIVVECRVGLPGPRGRPAMAPGRLALITAASPAEVIAVLSRTRCGIRADLRIRLSASDRERQLVTGVNGPQVARRLWRQLLLPIAVAA
jgi:ribosomal protein S28E/S33